MTRLTKGMYGTENWPIKGLFGLECAQMYGYDDVIHNGGWYNRAGEKLGWGDLTLDDIERITQQLEAGELFIILSEQDSFWHFVTDMGTSAQTAKTSPEIEAPGVDYVAQHAVYVIARHHIYKVAHFSNRHNGEATFVRKRRQTDKDVPATYLRPEKVKALLTNQATPAPPATPATPAT